MKPTGLFFAVRDEAKDILSNRKFGWKRIDGDHFVSGHFPLSLVVSGIGKAFASFYLSKISADAGRILIMGTSGGLSHEKIGTVYLAHEFCEHDMDLTGLGFGPGITPFCGMESNIITSFTDSYRDEVFSAAKRAGVEPLTGRVASGDLFLHKPEIAREKRELFGAVLADMESAAVAKICWKIRREVLALRYITDNADHDSANDWRENVQKSAVLFNKILEEFTGG